MRRIDLFVRDIMQEGFYEWDKSKEEKSDLTYYRFDTPNKRGLFTSIFGEKSYADRVGDVNIYLDPLSNPKQFDYADALVHKLMWHMLESAGITAVISSVKGETKKASRPEYHVLNQRNTPMVLALECDKRSLVQDQGLVSPGYILNEIKYLRDMLLQVEGIAQTLAPGLSELAENYPLTTPTSINRRYEIPAYISHLADPRFDIL